MPLHPKTLLRRAALVVVAMLSLSAHAADLTVSAAVCIITDKTISDNRLMADEEQEKLFALRSYLMTEINTETVKLLVTTGCISDGHMSAINKSATQTEMNGELLDILRRRNLVQYKLFIQCLREAKQDHVIHLLEGFKRKHVHCL